MLGVVLEKGIKMKKKMITQYFPHTNLIFFINPITISDTPDLAHHRCNKPKYIVVREIECGC